MRSILHIIDSLNRTDSVKQLLLLAQGLKSRGLDIHVASLDGGGTLAAEFRAAGISVTQLGRRWPIDPIAFVRFERLLFRLRPELVHTWDFDAGIHGRVAARMAGVRQLIAGHHRLVPSMGPADWFIERRLTWLTERLIVSSASVRDWYVQHGLPPEKFVVIRPGVSPARPSDVPREELLRELQLPIDARLIGVVGHLAPENRVKDLVWAADLLRVLHDNLRVLIVGDGPLRPQLEEYARLASDIEHIRFLGDRSDTWRIMPHLDVLWNASEHSGPSMTILEAMSAGVPVIASDTPANRELVIENETGYLVPLGTRAGRAARARHTDRIFTDAQLAARLASAAQKRVAAQFTAEQMVARYSELYRKFGIP